MQTGRKGTFLTKSSSGDSESESKPRSNELRGTPYKDGEDKLSTKHEGPPSNERWGVLQVLSGKDEGRKGEKKRAPTQDPPAGERPQLDFMYPDDRVASVVKPLANYNGLDEKATFQERFRALRAIDEAVHQIFKDHPVRDHGTLEFTPALKGLLRQTEAAHADLVEDLRQRTLKGEDGHLPFDAHGLGEEEKAKAGMLWQSLARGQGDVHVKGGEEFEKSMFASLAKLMQGPLGRELVGYADEAKGKHINIEEEDHDPDAEPYEQSTSDLRHVSDDPNIGGVDPYQMTRAVLDGESGVDLLGGHFDFNEGSGAKVRMPSDHRDPRALDDKDNEIVTPRFMALGHELGHAVKSKAGAKGSSTSFARLPHGLRPGDWNDSPEEYLNVKGVENPLRSEHNIKERGKYMASVESQRTVDDAKQRQALRDYVNDGFDGLYQDKRCDPMVDEANELVNNFIQLSDNGARKALLQQIDELIAKARAVHQLPLRGKQDEEDKSSPKKKLKEKGGTEPEKEKKKSWGFKNKGKGKGEEKKKEKKEKKEKREEKVKRDTKKKKN